MAIYATVDGCLKKIKPTTFEAFGVKERSDIQRFLKQQIDIVSPDTLVISEEFGNWTDSRRRIDLLGVDKDANLVVIEIKRTEDGGHMELQAIRYAAMASAMTFDDAVGAFERYIEQNQLGILNAKSHLQEFMDLDESELTEFPADVRLVLTAADFSPEITTTVLWLNEHGLDVNCVRLRPYEDRGQLLIDVQQIIPLPEAKEYQIRIRDKKVMERAARASTRDLSKFDVTVGSERFTGLPKRRAILKIILSLSQRGIDPEAMRRLISWKNDLFCEVPGTVSGEALESALSTRLVELGRQPNSRRYFIGDDEIIHANGKTYCVTNQWGGRTRRAMDVLIDAFASGTVSYSADAPEAE